MASLSLPRVLHPRKTSLEIEREQFEKAQAVAIQKAISKEESPVKQKHVRSAIIGTFQHQGAEVFWSIAVRLPYLDDVIVAWKFCYVLHKVLREGHPLCVVQSMRHTALLEEIGKLWVRHWRQVSEKAQGSIELAFQRHLTGYGKLIEQYTALLNTKLHFHNRNPKFPSNLGVTTDELKAICAGNPDICFPLSVEIFDYLDAILELQKSIYNSHVNSMTMQGQCRFAAIIPCIQDASRLYDHNVKILYWLHSMVDYDALEGHRTRFNNQYKLLKQFYDSTNGMQYFKNLISIPSLSDPPNFKANFNTYVTQEVHVQPEEEHLDMHLIDTSDTSDLVDSVPPIPPKPAVIVPELPQPNFDIIMERDNIIKSLHEDIDTLRSQITQMGLEREEERSIFRVQLNGLQAQLSIQDEHYQSEKDVLEKAMKVQEDEKAKEDKYMKSYMKLREEHISLLREKGKIDKSLKTTERALQEIQANNRNVEEEFETMAKRVEGLQLQLRAAQETAAKLESLKLDNQGNEKLITDLRSQLNEAIEGKQTVFLELENTRLQKDKLREEYNVELSKCKSKNQELAICQQQAENKTNALILACIESYMKIVRHAVDEIDNPALSALICSPDYLHHLSTICQAVLPLSMRLQPTSKIEPAELIEIIGKIAFSHANYILQGKATSNTCPDIVFGEKMADACKVLGLSVINLFERVKFKEDVSMDVENCSKQLTNVKNLTDEITNYVRGHNNENLDSMLEEEMQAMDRAIEDAVKQIEEMLSKSRVDHSGIKLEVNERILDTCTTLMEAIRVLVQKSRLLQAEIVAQGKGTAGTKEFYKRNHRWTDGFISAAKAVGASAKFLLSVADEAVTNDGKLEALIVAAQNISASTAQLVVASRVKADRHSNNLKELSIASKNVNQATAAVVATVKDCSKLMDESSEIDTSHLSLHHSKRLEMDSQVRVLELEKELVMERQRLAQLRRHHYQLEDEMEKRLGEETDPH